MSEADRLVDDRALALELSRPRDASFLFGRVSATSPNLVVDGRPAENFSGVTLVSGQVVLMVDFAGRLFVIGRR